MPTVIRAHGLRFTIFVDDHLPSHVHVSGRGAARIGIADPQPVLTVLGMSKADVAKARNTVRESKKLLSEAWARIHGSTD